MDSHVCSVFDCDFEEYDLDTLAESLVFLDQYQSQDMILDKYNSYTERVQKLDKGTQTVLISRPNGIHVQTQTNALDLVIPKKCFSRSVGKSSMPIDGQDKCSSLDYDYELNDKSAQIDFVCDVTTQTDLDVDKLCYVKCSSPSHNMLGGALTPVLDEHSLDYVWDDVSEAVRAQNGPIHVL